MWVAMLHRLRSSLRQREAIMCLVTLLLMISALRIAPCRQLITTVKDITVSEARVSIMDASVTIRMIVEIIQMKETVKTTTIGNDCNGDDDDDDDDDDDEK